MEKSNYAMIRTDSAGVHFGVLDFIEPKNGFYEVHLKNARRVWSWEGANCLSELSTLGSSAPEKCKISIPVTSIKLMAIEVIEMTPKAIENLCSTKDWVTVATETVTA